MTKLLEQRVGQKGDPIPGINLDLELMYTMPPPLCHTYSCAQAAPWHLALTLWTTYHCTRTTMHTCRPVQQLSGLQASAQTCTELCGSFKFEPYTRSQA